MITIFGDFYPFSAKKLAFFSNTNVMITILQKLALFCVKNANIFAKFFGENILKIITSVPGFGKIGIFLTTYVYCNPFGWINSINLSKKSPLFLPTFVLKTLICVRQI
jgi:hypothetical protein